VSRDLAYADVYVSHIRPEAGCGRGVAGLQSAAGFIQTQLAAAMRIRKIPHLRFHEDASVREGFDMVKKIEGLMGEERRDEPAGE
jgi:ribosome-binding factor A